MQSVFGTCVGGAVGGGKLPDQGGDHAKVPIFSFDKMWEYGFGQRNGTEVVDFHKLSIYGQTRFFNQRSLADAAVVQEGIYLSKEGDGRCYLVGKGLRLGQVKCEDADIFWICARALNPLQLLYISSGQDKTMAFFGVFFGYSLPNSGGCTCDPEDGLGHGLSFFVGNKGVGILIFFVCWKLLTFCFFPDLVIDVREKGISFRTGIYFGDFDKYKIRRIGGISLGRNDQLYWAERAVGFMGWLRFDGKLVNSNAIKYLLQA